MEIAIVGAGLTGLAAAISLRRAGHTVTIYERSSLTNEIGAAINVPPNVGRFLLGWGLDPVRSRFVKTPGMYFMSHQTLEAIPNLRTDHSRNVELFGAPLYYAHRVDLHEALRVLAVGADGPGVPVVIRVKSEVRGYDPETPSITLTDGTLVKADLVIAADGVHSTAVEYTLGHPNPSLVPAGYNSNVCYRFLITKDEVDNDPETSFFTQSMESLGCRIWVDMAGRKRLIQYPCRDYEILNFVAMIYDDDVNLSTREDWLAPIDKSEVQQKWSNFNPKLLAVLNKATEVKRWPLLYRAPIPTWHKANLALAGDAAHPMLPNHGQGGAQGIEDGLALGLVLHGATTKSQIPARLALYETIRRNRASAIQVMSNFGFDEQAPDELVEFLEGVDIPTTTGDMLQIAYKPDIVKRSIETMTAFDPSWKLPDGFFVDKDK